MGKAALFFDFMASRTVGTGFAEEWGPHLDIFARQVVEGFITGLHKSPFHGFSVEFAEHRLYNPGESVRNIDWKLYGRTEKLFVKRFEEETNLRCHLVIDRSSSMYYPTKEQNKLTFSVYAAAALIYLFRKQRDAFGLISLSDRVEFTSPAKSTMVHQKYLYAELERMLQQRIRPQRTALAEVLHQIAEMLHKRSMVIIFSDMFETVRPDDQSSLFGALQHLRHNKHEVIVFNVLDHAREVEFDFGNRPYHFVDLETGEELKLHPLQIRDTYRNAVNAFRKDLALKCAQYHIDLVDADIQSGYTHVLQEYLIKRSRMGG